MAYNAKQLARAGWGAASDTGPSNVTQPFMYRSTETIAQLLATNYFLAAYERLIFGSIVELIASVGGTPTWTKCLVIVSSASSVVLMPLAGAIPPVNVTAATLAVTPQEHANRTVTLNKVDGQAITLPAATGTGNKYRFVLGSTVTSVGTTIKVATAPGTDIMTGLALVANDAADTLSAWETAADSDTITLNGSTKGGIKGDAVELEDIASGLWAVRIVGSATGTEATPFSAAVP